MDPFSFIAGLAIAAGAIYVDVRGVDRLKEHIDAKVKLEAKTKTLIIQQPTEKYIIDFSEKNKQA